MGILDKLFSFGRLKRAPKGQIAGRVLAPASVQRTQLGVKEVDLPRGVVKLRSGEVRCFLRVSGFSAHTRSAADVRSWLQDYARCLNTLPGNAVLLVRSRAGGLVQHIDRQRVQTAALVVSAPGSGLAKLAADQLMHARQLAETGATRETAQYVALHSPKGDTTRLLDAARACRDQLQAIGVRAELVTDRTLGDALTVSWRPETGTREGWTQDFEWPAGSGDVLAVLSYSPGDAKVTTPRYADPAPPPAATVRQVGASKTPKTPTLPRRPRKALPL